MLLTTSKGTIASWFRLMAMELGVLALLTGCLSGPGSGPGPGDPGPGNKRIDGERVEIEGYIVSLGESSLVVYETTVVVDDSTRIEAEEEHGEMTFEDLVVGMWVELTGTQVGAHVIADRIEVDNREDDHRIVL